jgi:hypothetical protein
MQTHSVAALALITLCGCTGDSSSSSSSRRATTSTQAAVSTPAQPAAAGATDVRGTVRSAPAETTVLLLGAAERPDLLALGDAVLDLQGVDSDGAFLLHAPAGRTAREVVVSAPGQALLRASLPLTGPLVLDPEARVACRVVGQNQDALEGAFALVLDAAGVPMPLPPVELVSTPSGVLTVTGLPAGTFELLVAAADGDRYGSLVVDVTRGQHISKDLELAVAPELERRFLKIAAGIDTQQPNRREETR